MKKVDTPPILTILISKQQTTPKWLSFIYTNPKIGGNGLHWGAVIFKNIYGFFCSCVFLHQ